MVTSDLQPFGVYQTNDLAVTITIRRSRPREEQSFYTVTVLNPDQLPQRGSC